jgi:penicillin-binding protein 1A
MKLHNLDLERIKPYLTPRNVFYFMLGLIIVPMVLAFIYTAIVLATGLPPIEQLENPKPELATQIVSADGEVLGQFYIKHRRYMPFDSIPKDFINGLIATEDRDFFNHWGINLSRLFKNAVINVVTFKIRGGASTITQQLARNLYLSHEKTLSRKIKEAFTTLELERTHTKREILELYANTVHFGRGADGLQVASEVYFGKQPQQLTTAECAYLVGIVQRPARYEKDYEASIARRNVVLLCMADEGYISAGQYKTWKSTATIPVQVQETEQTYNLAPHFVEMIRQKLRDDAALKEFGLKDGGKTYDLYRDGLIITTTLNARMQNYANEAVEEQMTEFQKEFNKFWDWNKPQNQALLNELAEKTIKARPEYVNAESPAARTQLLRRLKQDSEFMTQVKKEAIKIQTGFVAIEHATGEIRAMVGSTDFAKDNRYALNRVTQIHRQPGSSFKAFVYACALNKGLSPYSRVDCGSLTYTLPSGKTWYLAGREGDEEGKMTLAEALKFSVNSVAARLITEYVTPSEVIKIARKAGISSDLDAIPAIALGAEEVSPMEMAGAFGIFPNQGMYIEPYFISKIEDRFGNVLYDHSRKPSVVTDAIKPRVARDMVGMMRNVVNSGTAARVRRWFPYEAAGKTGTTNDYTDAWFVGFTPQLTAGVWTGFDDQRVKFTGAYGEGGKAAAPIWGRFMAKVYRDRILGYKSSQRFSVDFVDAGQVPASIDNPPTEAEADAPPPDSSKKE